MQENELIHKLITVLCGKFNIDYVTDENLANLRLTGPEMQLSAIQMYEYLICIENEWGVYFSADDIQKSDFRTVSGIRDALLLKLADNRNS